MAFASLVLLAAAQGQQPPASQQPPSRDHQHNHPVAPAPPPRDIARDMERNAQAEAETMQAMQPGHPMDHAHMRMTPRRSATPRDRERAAQIVTTLREVLEPYKDYRVALADGYRIFMPNVRQREYHFNNYWNGFLEGFTFDPARPTSLLYRKTRDGYELTGVMYTAPKSATLEQLHERVPLGVASWHAHINLCMPDRSAGADARAADWARFGLRGSITTADACRQAGGRFYPQVFGWMVHVYPYAAPENIWAQ